MKKTQNSFKQNSFKQNSFEPNFYEETAWDNGKYVCGIDEVGRGCLAGPVVTCACILPQNTENKLQGSSQLIRDSKLMTKEQREQAFTWIKKNCFYSIAISDHKKIDQINIYQATKITMQKSLLQLLNSIPFNTNKVEFVLIDAMPLNISLLPQATFYHFPKGETYSTSIAAASIVAKVFRDDLMTKLEKVFPKFKFGENKGYGTGKHVDIIKKESTTIIHRKSFLNKIPTPEKQTRLKQASLF